MRKPKRRALAYALLADSIRRAHRWSHPALRALRLAPSGRIPSQAGGGNGTQAIHDQAGLELSIQCGHVLLTTEKIRARFDNISDKKDRTLEGEVVKKDDDDG
jgi:hypothetical protein